MPKRLRHTELLSPVWPTWDERLEKIGIKEVGIRKTTGINLDI
jgi:hypothetical protein